MKSSNPARSPIIKRMICILALTGFVSLSDSVSAEARPYAFLDQHYGPHAQETFDLWLPKSRNKAPLVIYIHGGGWQVGSKDDFREAKAVIQRYLTAGVAIASINYRFLKHAPLQTIMREDIGGFVQYMRANAGRYHLDSSRILPYGFSAGASASLWLATHSDLADPTATDPIKRESTRVLAAGHLNGQISYDFLVWYRFFGEANTDHFMGDQVWSRYHFKSKEELFTEAGTAVRQDLDSYGNLSPDDAPLLLWNSLDDDLTRDQNHFVHSPQHTRLLGDRAAELGIKTQVLIKADGAGTKDSHASVYHFFMGELMRSGYLIRSKPPAMLKE